MKKMLALLALFTLVFATTAFDDNDAVNHFRASLRGLSEVPPVATEGTGTFSATLTDGGTTLEYTETFKNLNAKPIFSHIHFGATKEAAGVMVFLCGPKAGAMGGPPAGFPDPPACPDATSGTFHGSVTVANVVGPDTQGITPKVDFAKVVKNLRDGFAYVNLHTTRSPAGEIRGQVKAGQEEEEE
jgi:hypothetical protein